MARTFVLLLLVVILGNVFVQASDDDLISVVALYRHGDRAPTYQYTNDPYADDSQWPLGYGELTNLGKQQHYNLGKWLRKRYTDFLPVSYSNKDIKIRSSNVDRCLMSAQLNLAGLYPPQGNQVWNEKLRWQPIPVHTVPETEDAVIVQTKSCPKLSKLYQQFQEEEPYNTTLAKYEELMEFYSEQSGDSIIVLQQLILLYDTVYIKNLYNQTQPEWTQSLLTEEFAQFFVDTLSSYAYTQDLARLKSGPLIDLILSHFENARNNVTNTPKFLMLSGHDSTIITLLTAMQIFDNKRPNYASLVLFELREGTNGSDFVNIFYRNPTEVVNLALPDCQFDCDFDTFEELLAPVRINEEDWDQECQTT